MKKWIRPIGQPILTAAAPPRLAVFLGLDVNDRLPLKWLMYPSFNRLMKSAPPLFWLN